MPESCHDQHHHPAYLDHHAGHHETDNTAVTHNSSTDNIACMAYLKAMIQHICRGSNCKDHEEEDEEASLPVVGTDMLG